MKYALSRTFLARKDTVPDGSVWIPAYSRLIADFGMPFLAQTWRPEGFNIPRGFRQGSVAVGTGFASNMWTEFWPDIRKRFKILRHAPMIENGVLVQMGPVLVTDTSPTGAITPYTTPQPPAPASGIPSP